MEKVCIMRLLRIRYGISTRELAEAIGVSQQYISDIELNKYSYKRNIELLIQKAFESIIEQRLEQARCLAEEYAAIRHRLLDIVMGGGGYEL